ncbi:SGNH/GDSL hydrolase family protein [Dyadobacter psychrotolerans]|uniref:GDSL family lipase n=1 Tax=Dyadobacter psychrotolerans TaxID=2541721 RepID=A0A4R5DE80_9BACT|nr:SGNH/GDSL hydrolase family protein [Dyadobacter psychrotolerans]TDE12099.1 GDSL family lipase [Dyadobacter psychrotolerans]
MRNTKLLTLLGYILLVFITLPQKFAAAQNKTQTVTETPGGTFDLKNGDRVVFLGSSVFEDDFQYGYLELALTTRFPDRNVTFRNLGWSGDNVWGDARSTFTNPPTAYQHLMRNIAEAQPTIVFLAYGGVEAQEGQAGLARFQDGLNSLLNKIDELGSRVVLLSPVPVLSGDSSANIAKRNADLKLYSSAIAKIASERKKRFIDVFTPIQEAGKRVKVTEDGVHLNDTGYYYLAGALEKGLGLSQENKPAEITVSKSAADGSPSVKILDSGKDFNNLKFTVEESYLSLPIPSAITDQTKKVKISGLKKGIYTLTADNEEVVTASAKKWAEGVEIKQGPSFVQTKALQQMILQKNDLHFFQYRPMNETYIIGFRAYEQGKHTKDLADQSILIKWIESQIALNRKPKEHIYKLVAVGN